MQDFLWMALFVVLVVVTLGLIAACDHTESSS